MAAAGGVLGLACRRGLHQPQEQPTLFAVLMAVQQQQQQQQQQWTTDEVASALVDVAADAVACVPSVAGDRLFVAMSVYRAAFESGVHDDKVLATVLWKMLTRVADVSRLDAQSKSSSSSHRVTNRTLVIDTVATNVAAKLDGSDDVGHRGGGRRRHHHDLDLHHELDASCTENIASARAATAADGGGPRWYNDELGRHTAASRAARQPTMAYVLDGALHRLFHWLIQWAASPRLATRAVVVMKGLCRKARKAVEASMSPNDSSNAKVALARLLLLGTALMPLPESAGRLNQLLQWLLGMIENRGSGGGGGGGDDDHGKGLEVFAVHTVAHILAHGSPTAVPDDVFMSTMRGLLVAAVARRRRGEQHAVRPPSDGALQDAAAYCLLQRLGRPESLAHARALQQQHGTSPTLGDLLSDLYSPGTAAHPALLLLLNVFVLPHLGCLQHTAVLLPPSSDVRLDVSAAVAYLDAHAWPTPRSALARTRSLLDPVIFPAADESAPPRCVPDLRALGELAFAALVRAVVPTSTSAGAQRGRRRPLALSSPHAGALASQLGSLSSDLVGHILSFMTFRRVCRVACVSTHFRNAARASALWEQLYWRRFGADTRVGRPLSEDAPQGQCCRCFQPAASPLQQAIKGGTATLSVAHCGHRGLQHDWARLFREQALASRVVCVGNVGRARSAYKMRVCPCLGCAFVIRTKAQEGSHMRAHLPVT